MTNPQVAESYTQVLQRLRDGAAGKVKDRNTGAGMWQWTNGVLGISALILGIIGGSAILSEKDIVSARALGIAVLVGAICGSVGTFLRAEDRFFANKQENAEWTNLVHCIDRAHAALTAANFPTATAEQVVKELEAKVDTQMKSDLARRRR